MSTSSDKSDASIESSPASKKRKRTEIAEKVDTTFLTKIMNILDKYEKDIQNGKKYGSISDLVSELRSEVERDINESDE